jgi:elongation factor P hydroxylase
MIRLVKKMELRISQLEKLEMNNESFYWYLLISMRYRYRVSCAL